MKICSSKQFSVLDHAGTRMIVDSAELQVMANTVLKRKRVLQCSTLTWKKYNAAS